MNAYVNFLTPLILMHDPQFLFFLKSSSELQDSLSHEQTNDNKFKSNDSSLDNNAHL